MSLAYSRFLGYDQGEEKYTMVVNKEQADEVRRIFFLFLQGYSTFQIAKIMMDEGAQPPFGESGNGGTKPFAAYCQTKNTKGTAEGIHRQLPYKEDEEK